ncbi:MAG: PAS domain S-box protein [Proteobacteria bacterium]|nr:PAS domain S-box protein [Pseudomonadota bacterium]
MPLFIRGSLSFRQAMIAVVVTLVLGVVISAGQIFLDLSLEQTRIENVPRQIVKMLRAPAAQAAYGLDENLAGVIIDGLFQYRPIRKAELVDDFGSVLASRERPGLEDSWSWLADRFFPDDMKISVPLTSKRHGRRLGFIHVWLDNEILASNFIKRVEMAILSGFIGTLLLALIMTLTFFYSITRPILKIVNRISETDPARPDSTRIAVPRGHQHNELGMLAETINRLLDGFEESLRRRGQIEEALQEREAHLRGIMESVPEGILTINDLDHLESCNPAAEGIFGVKAETLIGRAFTSLIAAPENRTIEEILDRIRRAGDMDTLYQAPFECSVLRPDSGLVPARVRFSEMRLKKRRLIVCVISDISRRKLIEDALRKSEQNYREEYQRAREREELYVSLLNSTPDAVIIYDLEGNTRYINPAFTRLFGYSLEEIKGRRVPFVPETNQARTRETIATVLGGQPVIGFETARLTRDGRELNVSLSSSCYFDHEGHSAGIVVFLRDVTETKQMEGQLRQAQKMEAVGTLASGVAHDFNNVLQAISGHVQLLRHHEKLTRQGERNLDEIEISIQRAADLVRYLLAFGRKVESTLSPIDLNEKVHHAFGILERTLPKSIRIETRLARNLKLVNGDSNQIEQIIMNLAANAMDAMPDGGCLVLSTENAVIGEGLARTDPSIMPGDYVLLTVSDTGHGMDDETQKHIFDPFFTTKGVGQGTGLGLSMVYGLVKGHGGHIVCRSRTGMGTDFDVYLPMSSARADMESPPSAEDVKPTEGGETLLIVDDEQAIRETVRELLETSGYSIHAADSGEQALQIVREAVRGFDLVILDLGMPGMGGENCLKGLMEIDPGLKVVVASGYSDEGRVEQVLAAGAAAFIAKPYRLADMLKTVRRVLGGRS